MGNNLFGIGFGELALIAVLALIIFGPRRIPEIAQTIGRFLRQVRQATGGIEDEMRRLVAGEGDPATWLDGASPPAEIGHSVSSPGRPPAAMVPAEPAASPGDGASAPDDGPSGPAPLPPAPAG